MKSALWSIIAVTLLAAAVVSSYVEYQSGALHNNGTSVIWSRPD